MNSYWLDESRRDYSVNKIRAKTNKNPKRFKNSNLPKFDPLGERTGNYGRCSRCENEIEEKLAVKGAAVKNASRIIFKRRRFVVRIAQKKVLVANYLIRRTVRTVFARFVVFYRHLEKFERQEFAEIPFQRRKRIHRPNKQARRHLKDGS
jgi:hypothetical protein